MRTTDLALARAMAAKKSQQQAPQEIRAIDVGEGWGFLGFELQPVFSEDKSKLAAMLFAVGTKQSLIASATMTIVKAAIAPLAEVSLENLRTAFAQAENPPKTDEAAE